MVSFMIFTELVRNILDRPSYSVGTNNWYRYNTITRDSQSYNGCIQRRYNKVYWNSWY
jgi:hypothetical protein